MKKHNLARASLLVVALAAFSGCDNEGAGFSGTNDNAAGGGGGGGGGAGGVPGVTTEPRLAYQPEAGAALGDTAIAGNASRIVFVSDENTLGQNPSGGRQIFTADIGSGGLVQVTMGPEAASPAFANFDITDDGSRVVFVSLEDRTGDNAGNNSNIFLAATDVVPATVTQVTNNTAGALGDPEISGDGFLIAFYSQSDLTGDNPLGVRQIFSINSDGTGLFQVTAGNLLPEALTLSDDGSRIAYQSGNDPFGTNADSSSEIFVINMDGTGLAQLTMSARDSFAPKLSDDGTRVVFTSNGGVLPGSNPDGSYEVYVANTDGTGLTQITSNTRDSGTFANNEPGAVDISGNGAYVVFGSIADLTGENTSLGHTIFWGSVVGGTIGQPLRFGTVPAGIDSRAADNPHMTNDGNGIFFESVVNYSFDATGSNVKLYTTVRQ